MSARDRLLTHATLLDRFGQTHGDQAIAISHGRIAWCGPSHEVPVIYHTLANIEVCHGKLITPAFIDCHTHLVYAGNRADEFARRLRGESYTDISRSGGGILSTVKKTRAASQEELFIQSLPRILAMRAEGVGTVEIKSGYGLDLENELKMLRVARQLGKEAGIQVITTFLGAHAVPAEFKDRKQDYVEYVCSTVLPAVAEEGLADAIDVFSETIGFNLEQTETLFQTAKNLGMKVKCHAEQLTNSGAAALAAQYGALSCDHLEYVQEEGIAAMARMGTVAVLLPGAYYFLQESKKPPIALLREKGVGIAIATDCNPGSSPTTSLSLMMNMACQFFSLSVQEVLSAVTWHGAKALGIEEERGALEPGKSADLLRWEIHDPVELCYHFGYPIKKEMMLSGEWKQLSE